MTRFGPQLAEIARRRAAGQPLDRAEIDARFQALAGASFDDAGVLTAFADVFDAVCAPPHISFAPELTRCRLDVDRRELRFGGLLKSAAGDRIGQIERHLDFQIGVARHSQIVVNPMFRDVGIAAIILAHSMEFYARVGLNVISLTAALTTGPYYWAKLGFDFAGSDAETTRDWLAQVSGKLGLGLDCQLPRTPSDWLRAGHDQGLTLSLQQVVDAFPEKRTLLEGRANDCEILMSDQLPLGKALLLSVSSWEGRLVVDKRARTRVRAYVAAKGERAAKRLRNAIDSPPHKE